jgi:hypothetical protein
MDRLDPEIADIQFKLVLETNLRSIIKLFIQVNRDLKERVWLLTRKGVFLGGWCKRGQKFEDTRRQPQQQTATNENEVGNLQWHTFKRKQGVLLKHVRTKSKARGYN